MRLPLAALVLSASAAAALADGVTTRIETRPYYGAITTIEQGVRVTRALPRHDRIIINPDGAAKVTLNVGSNEPSHAPASVQQLSTTTNVHGPGPAIYGAGSPYVHRVQPGAPRAPHQRQGHSPLGKVIRPH